MQWVQELLDPYRRGPKLRYSALVNALQAENLAGTTIEEAIEAANKIVEYVAGDEEITIVFDPPLKDVEPEKVEPEDTRGYL